MKKIIIITGIFIFVFSFIFSSNYHPKLGIKGNLDRMELVVYKGRPTKVKECWGYPNLIERFVKSQNGIEKEQNIEEKCGYVTEYQGRIAIPFKYCLILSLLLITVGIFLI